MPTIIVNKHNLPANFVRATEVDRHRVNGDISVTQLIDAPQIRILKRKFVIEEDVMDRIWMMMGTAVHKVLELGELDTTEARILTQAADILEYKKADKASAFIKSFIEKYYPEASTDVMLEHTLTLDIEGWTLSGTADRIVKSEKAIEDYKNTSVWSWIYPEARKKWKEQLNIYAYMCEMIGIPIEKLRVIAIFKDWKAVDKLRNKDYPPEKVMVIDIKREPNEKIKSFIEKRIRIHKVAEDGIYNCNANERWASPDVFAVMKKGGKRATSVHTTKEAADLEVKMKNHMFPPSQALYVETRKGGSKRCAEFCPVAQVCNQRKEELEELKKEEL